MWALQTFLSLSLEWWLKCGQTVLLSTGLSGTFDAIASMTLCGRANASFCPGSGMWFQGAIALASYCQADEDVSFVAMDISDAFNNIPVRNNEVCFTCARLGDAFYCFIDLSSVHPHRPLYGAGMLRGSGGAFRHLSERQNVVCRSMWMTHWLFSGELSVRDCGFTRSYSSGSRSQDFQLRGTR